jgi:hypothetical protein
MAITEWQKWWQKMAIASFGHLDSSSKFASRKEKVAEMKFYVITNADKSQFLPLARQKTRWTANKPTLVTRCTRE